MQNRTSSFGLSNDTQLANTTRSEDVWLRRLYEVGSPLALHYTFLAEGAYEVARIHSCLSASSRNLTEFFGLDKVAFLSIFQDRSTLFEKH